MYKIAKRAPHAVPKEPLAWLHLEGRSFSFALPAVLDRHVDCCHCGTAILCGHLPNRIIAPISCSSATSSWESHRPHRATSRSSSTGILLKDKSCHCASCLRLGSYTSGRFPRSDTTYLNFYDFNMLTPKTLLAITAAFGTLSSAKELPVDMERKAAIFDNGIRHEQIMALKNVSTGMLTSQCVLS